MTTDPQTRPLGPTGSPTGSRPGSRAAKIGLPGLMQVLETAPPAGLRSLRAGARRRLGLPADAPPAPGEPSSPVAAGIAGKAPCV